MSRTGPGDTGSDVRAAGRTTAEWATFAASCLVLAVVAGLALVPMLGPHEPATPRAVLGDITTVGGAQHVAVDVTNGGDDAATNVQVELEITAGGEADTSDQTIDFLAGGEVVHLVFVVGPDVGEEQLAVAVTGFTEP